MNLDAILKIIDRLMSLASAFFLGAKVSEGRAQKAEAARQKSEIEAKEAQIDLEVEKSRRTRTAGDIIRDNIARGRSDDSDPK